MDSSSDIIGQYNSIAVDSSDNPHISYMDGRNAMLKYALKIGGVWSIETVEDPPIGASGIFNSITLDSTDNPHISYQGPVGPVVGHLKYATKSGGSWSIQTVDTTTTAALFTSIALDSRDKAHISYQDASRSVLKYALGSIPPIFVDIDIKPDSEPNCFNNEGHSVIPVAILGSANFDVTEIDASTVELEGLAIRAVGKSNKLLAHIEDVNGDGLDDLVVQIEEADGVFSPGDTTATLTGNLSPEFDSAPFEGTDSICIV